MNQVKKSVQYFCQDTVDGAVTGRGICCAVMDTGIWKHPDLEDRIVGFRDFVNNRERPYDDGAHGTHVCGILGGSGKLSNGKYAGMAPGCSIVALKVLDAKGNGSFQNVIQGMEWLLDNYRYYGIRIVNISVGTLPERISENDRRLLHLVDALWDCGLVVVAAAGNYGPAPGTIAIPGRSRKIITVGASNDVSVRNAYRVREHYSGRGPTDECVMKPDVVAPGSGIYSCSADYRIRRNYPYVMKSGTSMATPVVSGAIALLLSKYPDMENTEVKLRLRSSCTKRRLSEYHQGWGEINVKRLLQS